MKKILMIHHSGSIGGAGISGYNTLISLSKRYEVVMYCPATPSDYSDFLKSKGIKFKNFDFSLGSIHYYSGGPPIYSPTFIRNLLDIKKNRSKWIEIIEYEKPDLIIVNSKILSWVSQLAREMNIKSLAFVRETRKKSYFNIWNNIQRYYLNKFSGVIFISKYDQDIEELTIQDSVVVPNYMNFDLYKQKREREQVSKEYGVNHSSFNILYVGGMARIKGIDIAIKSLKYLVDRNVNLIIVGDPNFHYINKSDLFTKFYNFAKRRFEKKISSTIITYKLDNKIHKLGIKKEMADMYTLADVLIFPANEPHQARPAFEAGVQKKPVILPDFDNTKEYLEDGINGLTFKKRNAKNLAKKINILMDNEELRKELGENNYKQTIKNHSTNNSENILMKFIDDILKK